MIGNRLMMMTDDEIRDDDAAADVFKKSQSRGSDIDLIDYSIKNHSSHVLTRSVQGTFLA